MKRKKINNKLQQLGQTLGLNDNEISSAKRTATNMLTIAIAAAIVMLIGRIALKQLDAIGMFYTGVSIKDFGLLSRLY
jgi:hypothetical protein